MSDKDIKARRNTRVKEKTTGRIGTIIDFFIIPRSDKSLILPEYGGLFTVRFDDNKLVEEEKLGNDLESL